MLVIRRKQMQVFDDFMQKGFEDRMVDYLFTRFPDACASKGQAFVREAIREGIERSMSYGVTAEYDVARYIDLMFRISNDFDTKAPWAAQILENPDLDSSSKMDQIWELAGQKAHDSVS
jgi:hypothetical protein